MTNCTVLMLPNDPETFVLSAGGVTPETQDRIVMPLTMSLEAFRRDTHRNTYLADRLTDHSVVGSAYPEHIASLSTAITPAEQGGLHLEFTGFPLVNSGSSLYLGGTISIDAPDNVIHTDAIAYNLRKNTATYQMHLQKPRTGVEGVSIVQGALYVTDRHCYIRFTYDKRTTAISNPQFSAVKIDGNPVTTYGFATTQHSTEDKYLISWGIVDHFTRSTSPTTVIEVIDPATGESLGSFNCVKPENGYW